MNIFKRAYLWAKTAFVKQDTVSRIDKAWYYPYHDNTRQKVSVEALRNLSRTPIARSAINQIKDGIKGLRYEVVSVDDKPHKKEINQINSILNNPNSSDDYYDFLDKILEDLLVLDMGCFEKKQVKSNTHPMYLFPVDAQTIEIVQDWNGDPSKPHYAQFKFGQKFYYNDNKIGMMQRTKLTYDDFGFSPMEQAFRHIEYLSNVQEYSDSISSNAMPKYIVNLSNKASQDEIDNVIAYIENVVAGNSTTAIVGTDSLDSKQISPIGDESCNLSWQKMLLQIISTCFNIDPTRLGSAISNDRSTVAEKDNEMLEYTIKPWSKIVERAINKHLIAQLGYDNKVKFQFNYAPTTAQKDMVVDRIVKLFDNDIITLGEARKELDGVTNVPLLDISDSDKRLSEYKNALALKITRENNKGKAMPNSLDKTLESNDTSRKGEEDGQKAD